MDSGTLNEAERLRALHDLALLDTPPEAHFEAVIRLAQHAFAVPIAVISLVDQDRQWFKARCGLEIEGTPRDHAFCNHTIMSDDILVVPDARADARFSNNPLVAGEPHIRFYAGAPLSIRPGTRIGTLCLIDTKPRSLTGEECARLHNLAQIVVAHLQLHQANGRQAAEARLRQEREALIRSKSHQLQRREAELLEANRLLAMAEQMAQVGHWRISLPSQQLTWSAEVSRIFGIDPGACPPDVPTVIAAHCHPEDRATLKQVYADLIASGEDAEHSIRLVRANGEIRLVTFRAVCEKDGAGQITGLFGVVIDHTEFKRTEDRARDSAALLSATLENMDQGLIMVDSEGIIQVANSRAEQLLALPKDFLKAKPSFEGVRLYQEQTGDYTAANKAALPFISKVGFDGTVPTYERERPDGMVIEVRTVPLPGGGAVRTYTDVTARKRFEHALANAKAAAEEARAEAERASAAKSEFLATMSHEVRTPLHGILGHTDLMLEDRNLADEQRRHAERIHGAGSALLTVVNDILDFSKIDAGQVELEVREFSPAALVDNALSIVRGMAEAKRLDLTVDAAGDLPMWVVGDPNRLRQILLNLLNNAVKFTPSGSVALSVRRGPGEGPLCSLCFSVQDTGIGIPHDKHDRLFQRFSQVDGSIRRGFGGTGLGLAISKRLIDLMGGEIGVRSREGHGTTFWFTVELPIARGDGRTDETESTEPRPARMARILLAEDNEMNQEIACAVLEAAGHRVDVVSDGAQAIMAVQAGAYDLVLMDIQMPNVDGITATRHIRALKHSARDVPIIAMTANVLPRQVEQFRAAGLSDHIGKPFRRTELYKAIERWTEPRDAAPAGLKPSSSTIRDATVLDGLQEIIGADGIKPLLGRLAQQLRSLSLEGEDPDPSSLAREAHKLVSSAGMLGFMELSTACRELEDACNTGREIASLLDRLRRERSAALAEVDGILAA